MSKLLRLKAVPWAIIFEGTIIVGGHWRSLPARERAQLVVLVRRSRGWPGNLTPNERAELGKLIGRLDATGIARELALVQRAARKSAKAGSSGGAWIGRLAGRGR
jgi:hypothetical protein